METTKGLFYVPCLFDLIKKEILQQLGEHFLKSRSCLIEKITDNLRFNDAGGSSSSPFELTPRNQEVVGSNPS